MLKQDTNLLHNLIDLDWQLHSKKKKDEEAEDDPEAQSEEPKSRKEPGQK